MYLRAQRILFNHSPKENLMRKKVHCFIQNNKSKSSYVVMRSLHFQHPPFTQSKLIRCGKGALLDVAADIRKGSPTYGQHVAMQGRTDCQNMLSIILVLK